MEWLKNNPLVVITDPNYWDCDCDENYIHKKSVSLSCEYYEKNYEGEVLSGFEYIFICSSPNWILACSNSLHIWER